MLRHVVLADDDEDDCFIFRTVLKEVADKAELICLNSCDELLAYLKNNKHPDLIFLDLNMPGMHGLECLAEMRGESETTKTIVIVYSTSSNPANIQKALEQGANSYIVKPHSVQELRQILRDIWEWTA